MESTHTLSNTALLLLLLIGNCHTGSHFRRWVPNTNYETPSNWALGKVPCANDHVRFPENMGTVFVQTNTTVTELILPVNGVLALGDYVSLSFPLQQTYTPGCPTDREVKYNRTAAKSWLSPDNWCVTATEGGECQADQPALLVSERVPCRTDTVSFPVSSSFLVGLGYGADIYVGTLLIAGKHYTTSTFKALVDSGVGKRTWLRQDGSPATTVTVTTQRCTDTSGCPCGNDRGSILDKICASSGAQCASDLPCTHPVKPMGGCCEICGAVMKLDIGSNFKKKFTESMILSKFIHGDDKYKNVKLIISKTSLGQIQIVLTHKGGGKVPGEMAYSLKRELEGNNKYDVDDIQIAVSKNIIPTPERKTGVDNGLAIGIVVTVIVLAAILTLIIYLVMRQRQRPSALPINLTFEDIKSTFRNFAWSHRHSESNLDTVSFKNMPADNVSYGFDNPVYGDPRSVQDLPITSTTAQAASVPQYAMTSTTKSKSSPTSFSNPMCSEPTLTAVFSIGGDVDSSDKAVLVMNPVFSTDGILEDKFV